MQERKGAKAGKKTSKGRQENEQRQARKRAKAGKKTKNEQREARQNTSK